MTTTDKSTTYVSTRGGVAPLGFCDAVMMGLGSDGGLLLPQQLPQLSAAALQQWQQLSYPQLAFAVMRMFIGAQEISDAELRDLVERSYASFSAAEVLPLRQVGDLHILELFHGPTLAFKDVALQFLGNLFEYILQKTGQSLNIVGATSGDTGSAAIYGVRGKAKINIFIMHPQGKVSPVQERQMTTVLDANVHNIAISGTFDDGQRVLKEIFADLAFKQRYHLGAVNSVNWARILAQVVYYFYAAFRAQEASGSAGVQICVPTGNFGNIFAGYVARQMGAPISRLLLATNENDILYRFFQTGDYSLATVHATLSPSMDIQVASNFERYLYYRLGEDPQRLQAMMQQFSRSGSLQLAAVDERLPIVAGRGDSAATLEVIRRYHAQYSYVPDPHTAVGIAVAEQYLRRDEPTVCLATAHPAKFSAAIEQALGHNPVEHAAIAALAEMPTRCAQLPATVGAIEEFIATTLAEDA